MGLGRVRDGGVGRGDLVSVLASRGPGKCVLGWAEKGQEADRTTIHP